jgi:hypothetical protein
MEKNFIENEFVVIVLVDNILIGTIKQYNVDLKVAQKAVDSRLEMCGPKSYPFLINIKSVKNVTKKARDFLASEKGCQGVVASAILINSSITSMVGNFFIKISKPLVPTKLFTNEEDAKQWLFTFVK